MWLFVKRFSQEAIQRHSQRDRPMKIKVFRQWRDAGDIPWRIILHTAGGVSYQSEVPTAAKAWCWLDKEDKMGTRRSNWSAERSGREELAYQFTDLNGCNLRSFENVSSAACCAVEDYFKIVWWSNAWEGMGRTPTSIHRKWDHQLPQTAELKDCRGEHGASRFTVGLWEWSRMWSCSQLGASAMCLAYRSKYARIWAA